MDQRGQHGVDVRVVLAAARRRASRPVAIWAGICILAAGADVVLWRQHSGFAPDTSVSPGYCVSPLAQAGASASAVVGQGHGCRATHEAKEPAR